MPVIKLNTSNAAHIRNVATLHSILLPESPVAKFGRTFMERFYYSKLIEDGLIDCFYYQYKNKGVGFITITKDPTGFLSKGLKKNIFNLILTMPLVLIKKPSRLLDILKVAQLSRSLGGVSEQCGAILSFGVLEQYRNISFLRKTGLRISHELFDSVLNYFKKTKVYQIELLVEPDNKETLLFYHMLGCQFKTIQTLGRSLTRVIYKL